MLLSLESACRLTRLPDPGNGKLTRSKLDFIKPVRRRKWRKRAGAHEHTGVYVYTLLKMFKGTNDIFP